MIYRQHDALFVGINASLGRISAKQNTHGLLLIILQNYLDLIIAQRRKYTLPKSRCSCMSTYYIILQKKGIRYLTRTAEV